MSKLISRTELIERSKAGVGSMARLTEEQVEQFNRDGLIMIDGLFDAEEMDLLIRIAKADQQVAEKAIERRDLSGTRRQLWINDSLGEDIHSAFDHCHRIVDHVDQ